MCAWAQVTSIHSLDRSWGRTSAIAGAFARGDDHRDDWLGRIPRRPLERLDDWQERDVDSVDDWQVQKTTVLATMETKAPSEQRRPYKCTGSTATGGATWLVGLPLGKKEMESVDPTKVLILPWFSSWSAETWPAGPPLGENWRQTVDLLMMLPWFSSWKTNYVYLKINFYFSYFCFYIEKVYFWKVYNFS